MTLTEAECDHLNNLRFMYEVNLRCSSHDISNDIILCFHDHEDLKKTLLKFIHVINTENSALSLTDYYLNFVIEIYQDSQKTFSEFTDIIHIKSSIVLFCHHDSDSVTESSSLSMHDNYADTSVVASASHSCHQYKSIKFINLINNFNDMKLDETSFIAAIDDTLNYDLRFTFSQQ